MIIDIELGTAYLNQGFFNIRMMHQHLIGLQQEKIKCQLGLNGIVIEGWINRDVNTNNAPRIMLGARYTNWVQINYILGDIMKVGIVNSNSLILFAKGESTK